MTMTQFTDQKLNKNFKGGKWIWQKLNKLRKIREEKKL